MCIRDRFGSIIVQSVLLLHVFGVSPKPVASPITPDALDPPTQIGSPQLLLNVNVRELEIGVGEGPGEGKGEGVGQGVTCALAIFPKPITIKRTKTPIILIQLFLSMLDLP